LIESLDADHPGFVTLVSVVELYWVLRALRMFEVGQADFADCLIERTASGAGCTATMTFDVGAAKHAGMTLIR